MELRRGERWADADPIGSLVFDLNNGLSLVSWNVDGASGEGNFPVHEGEPTNQSAVSNGNWTCQAAAWQVQLPLLTALWLVGSPS